MPFILREGSVKKSDGFSIVRLMVLVSFFIFVFSGCGRKLPPVPPGTVVPPGVTTLSHNIQGNTLTLTWTAPYGKGSKSIDGYEVLRSMTNQDEEECKGCPVVFQRIARLGSSKTSYSDTLVSGKRYIYKVVAVTSYQVQGKDSKLISFNFPEPSVKQEKTVDEAAGESEDGSEDGVEENEMPEDEPTE